MPTSHHHARTAARLIEDVDALPVDAQRRSPSGCSTALPDATC